MNEVARVKDEGNKQKMTVSIPDEEAENITTVQQAIDYVVKNS